MQDLSETGTAPTPVPAAELVSARQRVALLEGQVDQLHGRIAGLLQALDTRAGLEQAKGVLAERHGWTAEHAFEQISVLSQNTNTRVHDLARAVVAQATAPRGVDPDRAAWACRLLDLLPCTAVLLTPLYAEDGVDGTPRAAVSTDVAADAGPDATAARHGGADADADADAGATRPAVAASTGADATVSTVAEVVDFRVDYANPATTDLEGRKQEQVVGRRLSRIWPGAVASGLAERYVGVLTSGEPYSSDTQPLAELVDGQIVTTALRLRAMPFLGGVLVLWHDDEAGHRTHPVSLPRAEPRRRRR